MKSSSKRSERYKAKTTGGDVSRYMPQQKKLFALAVGEQAAIEQKVRNILHIAPYTSPSEKHFYVAFAKRLARIKKTHSGTIFITEACIEYGKWVCRGLNLYLLTEILKIFMADCIVNVKITDGVETATVSPDGYLDVKSHTPEKCFSSDYAGAQTNQVIVTPTAGKRIVIVSNYVSTEDAVGDITLKFVGAAQPFFKLYTKTKTEAVGNIVCAKGDVNQSIEVTCPGKTFVSIGYDEI